MFSRELKYVKPNNGVVPVRYTYDGGPYISVLFGSAKPVELACINVWDYDNGKSSIETREDFNKAVLNHWHEEQWEIRDCVRVLPRYI